MDYMTIKEASKKWGVSSRQVNYYCVDGRIPGAVKMAAIWLIPKNAVKPVDGRTKQVTPFAHRKTAVQVSPYGGRPFIYQTNRCVTRYEPASTPACHPRFVVFLKARRVLDGVLCFPHFFRSANNSSRSL